MFNIGGIYVYCKVTHVEVVVIISSNIIFQMLKPPQIIRYLLENAYPLKLLVVVLLGG